MKSFYVIDKDGHQSDVVYIRNRRDILEPLIRMRRGSGGGENGGQASSSAQASASANAGASSGAGARATGIPSFPGGFPGPGGFPPGFNSHERNIHAVIRGVPATLKEADIKEELQQKGYAPLHIIRLKRSGAPMPLVVVILPKLEKSRELFNEHELLGLAIRVEVQKNSRLIGQCHRCQNNPSAFLDQLNNFASTFPAAFGSPGAAASGHGGGRSYATSGSYANGGGSGSGTGFGETEGQGVHVSGSAQGPHAAFSSSSTSVDGDGKVKYSVKSGKY
nr:unnamed protein product [Callosobruchus analis]